MPDDSDGPDTGSAASKVSLDVLLSTSPYTPPRQAITATTCSSGPEHYHGYTVSHGVTDV